MRGALHERVSPHQAPPCSPKKALFKDGAWRAHHRARAHAADAGHRGKQVLARLQIRPRHPRCGPHRLAPSPTRACTAAARGLARATSCSGHARGGRRERWRRGQSVRRARRPDMRDARVLINHTGPVPSKAPGPGEEQLVVLTLTCGGDDGWGLGVQGTRGSCPAGCPSGCPPRAPWCMWGGRLVTKRLRCARSPCPALLQPHPDLPSKPHLGLWAACVHWCTAHP